MVRICLAVSTVIGSTMLCFPVGATRQYSDRLLVKLSLTSSTAVRHNSHYVTFQDNLNKCSVIRVHCEYRALILTTDKVKHSTGKRPMAEGSYNKTQVSPSEKLRMNKMCFSFFFFFSVSHRHCRPSRY